MKYEVVDKVEGTMIGSSQEEIKGRDHEKGNYGDGNQHPRTKRFDYDISMGKL